MSCGSIRVYGANDSDGSSSLTNGEVDTPPGNLVIRYNRETPAAELRSEFAHPPGP